MFLQNKLHVYTLSLSVAIYEQPATNFAFTKVGNARKHEIVDDVDHYSL